MYKKILKLIALGAAYSAFTVNACSEIKSSINPKNVSIEYTNEGVLRKNGQCDINFVNFGIKNDIVNIDVKKLINPNGTFNLALSALKNGNDGLNDINAGYRFGKEEIIKQIEVTQNGQKVKQYEVTSAVNGEFSLLIKDLKSCEGLSIKQTFRDTVTMKTYLLYSNVKPTDINHVFNIVEFGPSSNNVPYDTLQWNMNTGLDKAREKCGIYIDFHTRSGTGGMHWNWYLSTDNINSKKCDNTQFFEAVKGSYENYEVMDELFGDYYEGYVIKREDENAGHMDGILVNQKYLIEIYQNGCAEQNKDQVICTISSNKKLTYNEFKKEFVENCLAVIIDQEEEPEWSVSTAGITAKYSNYVLNMVNYNRGGLPTSETDKVQYKEFKAANSSGIARFSVSLDCNDGSYIGDKCRCQACPTNCAKCLDATTCTLCKENSVLINGLCECKAGYRLNNDGECVIIPTTTITTTTVIVTTPEPEETTVEVIPTEELEEPVVTEEPVQPNEEEIETPEVENPVEPEEEEIETPEVENPVEPEEEEIKTPEAEESDDDGELSGGDEVSEIADDNDDPAVEASNDEDPTNEAEVEAEAEAENEPIEEPNEEPVEEPIEEPKEEEKIEQVKKPKKVIKIRKCIVKKSN